MKLVKPKKFLGQHFLKDLKVAQDIADTVGGFVAIIFMPFAYSIATGIMFGILTWVILKIVTGKIKEIHPIMWVAFALFAVRIVTMICGVSS